MIFPPGLLAHQTGLAKSLLFLLLVGLAAFLYRRPRLGGAVALTAAFAFSSLWVLSLGRPYGLLVDDAITARSARIMVAAETGSPSLLGGATAEPSLAASLAAGGLSPGILILAFHGAPVIAAAAFVLLLALGAQDRDHRGLAALLGALLSFSDLDLVADTALAPVAWSHPRSAALGLGLLLTFVVSRRLGLPVFASIALPAIGLAVAAFVGVSGRPGATGAWLFALWALVPFASIGVLARSRDFTALAAAAGLIVVTLAISPWVGSAPGFIAARGLLILAVTPALAAALGAADSALPGISRWLPGPGGALAIFFLAVAPSTAPFSWRPPALDHVAENSLEPPSATLVLEMIELRKATSPSDVIVTSEALAPWVGAIAGRRVLRAPTLVDARDDDARSSAEFMILRGRAGNRLLKRFGVTHVLVTPGDFTDRGLVAPEALETRPGFTLVREGAARFRLYRVDAAAGGGA